MPARRSTGPGCPAVISTADQSRDAVGARQPVRRRMLRLRSVALAATSVLASDRSQRRHEPDLTRIWLMRYVFVADSLEQAYATVGDVT
jgi:hypothetical protein